MAVEADTRLAAVQQIANLVLRIVVDLEDLQGMIRELPEDVVPIAEEDGADMYDFPGHGHIVAEVMTPLRTAMSTTVGTYRQWQEVRGVLWRSQADVARTRERRAKGPLLGGM